MCAWPASIYCSLVHDTGIHWTSLYVSLDSHYRGKLAFPCIQKQLPSIYTHFIETCPQLEGHFRGLIRRAALTLNIWGLDRRRVLLSPWSLSLSTAYDEFSMQLLLISSTANFTLNNSAVVKTNVAVLIATLWYKYNSDWIVVQVRSLYCLLQRLSFFTYLIF